MDKWQLNYVNDVEYAIDDCGIYVLIYWQCQTNTVRLDIMSDNHEPRQSFVGSADNVRKHAMRWLEENIGAGNYEYGISLEHAAYIGSELEKADTMKADYVQDTAKPEYCFRPFIDTRRDDLCPYTECGTDN